MSETVQSASALKGGFRTFLHISECFQVILSRFFEILPLQRGDATATGAVALRHLLEEGIGRLPGFFQIGHRFRPALVEMIDLRLLCQDDLIEFRNLVLEKVGLPQVVDEVVGGEEEENAEAGCQRSRAEEFRLLFEPLLHNPLLRILHRKLMVERPELISHLPHVDGALRRIEGKAAINDFAVKLKLPAQPKRHTPGHLRVLMDVINVSPHINRKGTAPALCNFFVPELKEIQPARDPFVNEPEGDHAEAEDIPLFGAPLDPHTSPGCQLLRSSIERGLPEIDMVYIADHSRAEISHDRLESLTLRFEENIPGMKMPMKHPVLVSVTECFRNHPDHLPRTRFFDTRDRRKLVSANPFREREIGSRIELKIIDLSHPVDRRHRLEPFEIPREKATIYRHRIELLDDQRIILIHFENSAATATAK